MGILGESSYSLYLVHPFSLGLLAMIFSKLGISDYSGNLFVFLLIVISLWVGHLCYIVVEKPMIKFVKNTFLRPSNSEENKRKKYAISSLRLLWSKNKT